MQLIRTSKVAEKAYGTSDYHLADMSKFGQGVYFLWQPRFVVRILYETNKNQ